MAGQGQPGKTPRRDYPVQPVPFTRVHLNDVFWAPRIETNRTATHSVRVPAVRADAAASINFVRAAKALRGEELDEQAAAGLSVRRHRSLQGDRRRVLHAERAPRPEARRLRRRPHREDRRGAGEGRLSYTTRTIDPKNPHVWARHGAMGARARRQPRAVQPRAPLRSRGRAPPGDGQAHAARTSRSERPICSSRRSVPASDRSGPVIRSPRWGSSGCTASLGTSSI